MPHLTLEASYNTATKEQLTELLAHLHNFVGAYETVDIESLKSRLVDRTVFFSGAQGCENRFMYCTLDILPTRTAAWKKKIAKDLLAALKQASLSWGKQANKLSINVEIRELNAEFFLRDTL